MTGRNKLKERTNVSHCKHGHEFTPENTWINKAGYRVCKTCITARREAIKPRATQKSIGQRFWEKVEKGEGCWIWTAGKDSSGYGLFRRSKRAMEGAHRISYILSNGEIPNGQHVRHTCDNPACVNPDHLLLGTHTDNVRDSVERGRASNGRKAKTHCKQGHEFTANNTYIVAASGHRQCRTCRAHHSANRA